MVVFLRKIAINAGAICRKCLLASVRKGAQPLVGLARGKEFAFFSLCRLANLLFKDCIAHDHKMLVLQIGAARGETSS
jgi:hypothetical protein